MSIYDFIIKDAKGNDIQLSDYRGDVLLIVNVASKCGFTNQYEGLQALHSSYGDKGLTILGFPCNQFKGQEPGTNEEIQEFCRVNYGVEFPVMAKIDVNGEETDPLYRYLKAADYDEFVDVPTDHRLYLRSRELAGPDGRGITWNFNKFLVDRQGKVVGRYASPTTPEELAERIEALLDN